jgi:hypothetical protein
MKQEQNSVSQKEFLENMEKKVSDPDFLGDMEGLLRPDTAYKIENAYESIKGKLLEKI